MILLIIIEILLFVYFLYVVSYSIFFTLAGLFYRTPSYLISKSEKKNRIAIFIPAYREDNVIIGVAKQALNQSYGKTYYDVIVIADSLKRETIEELSNLDILVHIVQFEKSTKVKSLKSALNCCKGYEIAVVLDADNLMHFDFLEKINTCYNNGWKFIQGRRTAKNLNTSFAILDGISEAVNNHIYRQGPSALGLSCTIAGSGMALNYAFYKNELNKLDPLEVYEDKAIQAEILKKGGTIHYLKSALVYDEKVDNPKVFQTQRRRWVSSQYIYLKKLFWIGIKALFKGNLSLFNIAILAQIQFPRIINTGLLLIISIIAPLFQTFSKIHFSYWWFILSFNIISFILSIPRSYYNRDLLIALTSLPSAFFSMILVHFRLKGANNKFIHTPHNSQERK